MLKSSIAMWTAILTTRAIRIKLHQVAEQQPTTTTPPTPTPTCRRILYFQPTKNERLLSMTLLKKL